MLVLSRKKNQKIIIDGNIEIEVLQVKGNTIRLGVNAPRDVRVLRGELKPFGIAEGLQTDGLEYGAKFNTEIVSTASRAG